MLDTAQMNFSLDLFHGQLHRSSADVYVRLSGDFDAQSVWHEGWRLAGTLAGPHAQNSHTLPAEIPLEDMGAGESLLARVRLPDPCSWTPSLPLQYDVHIELLVEGETAWQAEQTIGLRQLGVLEQRLQLENEPWSLIGAHQRCLDNLSMPPADQVLFLDSVEQSLLEQCSREGGWLLTELNGSLSDSALVSMFRECARAAANWCVVLRDVDPGRTIPVEVAPNLLIGQWWVAGELVEPADWADIAFVELSDPAEFAELTASCQIPVVALQPDSGQGDWDDARAACQQLHHQLAAFRQFAGYIVV